MARISVGWLVLFPQQDDERAAHQEHKPHAVHPGQSGEEELQAEGEDERAQCRRQRPVCRRPFIEEACQEDRQGAGTDKAGKLLDILERLVQPRQHRGDQHGYQQRAEARPTSGMDQLFLSGLFPEIGTVDIHRKDRGDTVHHRSERTDDCGCQSSKRHPFTPTGRRLPSNHG